MSCATCPELVMGTLRADCADALQRLRQVQELVSILNRCVRDVAFAAADELNKAAELIPDPPLFDLRIVKQLATCPLTPQAWVTGLMGQAIQYAEQSTADMQVYTYDQAFIEKPMAQFAAMSKFTWGKASLAALGDLGVRDLLIGIAQQIDAVILHIYALIEQLKSSLQYGWLYSILFRYADEIDRVVGGWAIFTMRITVTSANAALVRTLCPDIYNNRDLPYKDFVEAMRGHTFDGPIPTTLADDVQYVLKPVYTIYGKIQAWQSARFALV